VGSFSAGAGDGCHSWYYVISMATGFNLNGFKASGPWLMGALYVVG
jgi:hypothetical protein